MNQFIEAVIFLSLIFFPDFPRLNSSKIHGLKIKPEILLTKAVWENIFTTIENRVLRLSFIYKIKI